MKLKLLISRFVSPIALPFVKIVVKDTTRTRVIILSANKILVVKNWLGRGLWSLPGGGLKKSESIISGAIREVKEETGICLEARSLLIVGEQSVEDEGVVTHLKFLKTRLKAEHPIKKQRLEIVDAQWTNIEKLDRKTCTKDLLIAIDNYLT